MTRTILAAAVLALTGCTAAPHYATDDARVDRFTCGPTPGAPMFVHWEATITNQTGRRARLTIAVAPTGYQGDPALTLARPAVVDLDPDATAHLGDTLDFTRARPAVACFAVVGVTATPL